MSRILVATGIFPPDIGGPATYSKLLLDELPRRGFVVDVLSFGVTRHLPKFIRHLAYGWLLWRKSADYDVIFAQDPISVGVASALVSRWRQKKFFIRVAGDYAWEQGCQRFNITDTIDDFQSRRYGWQVELFRKLQSWVVCSADQVITPSRYFREVVAQWGVSPGRITAIYNGINFPPEKEFDRLWQDRSPIIFSVGRLVPWKGFDGLIRLLADLPGWQLEIAGEGPERSRLETLVRELGLMNRVRFLGALSRSELWSRLSRVKIFALNTSFESFSFQTVESMYAGALAIVTNVGSLPELLTNDREGFLVAPDDLSAIKEQIKWAEDNVPQVEKIIQAARERSLQFSIQTTLDHLIHLFMKENL